MSTRGPHDSQHEPAAKYGIIGGAAIAYWILVICVSISLYLTGEVMSTAKAWDMERALVLFGESPVRSLPKL